MGPGKAENWDAFRRAAESTFKLCIFLKEMREGHVGSASRKGFKDALLLFALLGGHVRVKPLEGNVSVTSLCIKAKHWRIWIWVWAREKLHECALLYEYPHRLCFFSPQNLFLHFVTNGKSREEKPSTHDSYWIFLRNMAMTSIVYSV